MEERLIKFDTAKLAKEKGFSGSLPTICYFKENNRWATTRIYKVQDPDFEYIIDPTQSLLQKWLREKHNIHISIFSENDKFVLLINYYNKSGDKIEIWLHKGPYNIYEEALEIGLYESLKLI